MCTNSLYNYASNMFESLGTVTDVPKDVNPMASWCLEYMSALQYMMEQFSVL